MSVFAQIGVPVPVAVALEDGNEFQYPQAEMYVQGASVPFIVLDLDHKAKGRYEADFTPTSAGVLSALFFIYTDVGHAVESTVYSREIEQVFVTSNNVDDLAVMITRLLGLSHENAFIDLTSFDVHGQLTAARMRIFDSKISAQAATDGGSETTGLVAAYTMEAVYEGVGRLKSYRYTKD